MLYNCSTLKVASIFFKEPTKEHYLIEISRNINLAHTSVINHLKKLKQLNIITENVEKRGTRKFPMFKANINSKEFKFNKKIYNLILINDSRLIDFLKEEFMPNTIILFGSFSKGEDTEDSDIDIFLECQEKNINLNKFEKKLNRKIQLHFKENFNKYPKELKNNILNGETLYGFLEGF